MTHFSVMLLFALVVAVVFAALGRETVQGKVLYGLKVFLEFSGVGFALAWLLYFLPI